ncbi:hypothetical protein EON67_03445, partial [archaeon]
MFVRGFTESVLPSEVAYDVAAGTSPGSTNVAEWTPAGAGPVLSLMNLSLEDGARVWVMVRARNAAGLVSTPVSTLDAIVVDSLPARVSEAYIALQQAALEDAVLLRFQGVASAAAALGGAWRSDSVPPVATLGTPFAAGVSVQGGTTCASPSAHKVMMLSEGERVVTGDAGAANASAYACAPGYEYDDLFSACVPCAAGTFKSVAGDGACAVCFDASVATAVSSDATGCTCADPTRVFSSSRSSCVCAPGYVAVDTGECVPCAEGTYNPYAGSAQCIACPPRTRSAPALGSTSCEAEDVGFAYDEVSDSVVCAVGFTSEDSSAGCVPCPAGLVKDAVGGGACRECPAFTLPTADGTHCTPDEQSTPVGSVFVPTPVWQLACPPGTSYAPPAATGDARGICVPCGFHSYRNAPQLLPAMYGSSDENAEVLMSTGLGDVPWSVHELDAGTGFAASMVCVPCPDAQAPAFVSSTPVMYANWSHVFEFVGASNTFEFAVGTSVGGAQVLPFTPVGRTTAAAIALPPTLLHTLSRSNTSFITPQGVPLYLTVAARDVFGRSAVYAAAQPMLLDVTPPLLRAVIDGTPDMMEPGAQLVRAAGAPPTNLTWSEDASYVYLTGVRDWDFTRNASVFNVSFEAPADPDTHITSMAVCLGSAPGACDIHERLPAVYQDSISLVSFTDLNVTDGTTVYGTLFAMNEVHLLAMASTNGVEVVTSAGTPGRVFDTPA